MRPWVPKVARILALAWIWLAAIVILLSYAWLWYAKGFAALAEVANPFNYWNVIAILVTLLPGILLLGWADRRASR
jgi:hypothetical protein